MRQQKALQYESYVFVEKEAAEIIKLEEIRQKQRARNKISECIVSLKIIVHIAIVFTACISMLAMYALISKIQKDILKCNQDIILLNESLKIKQLEFDNSIDLEYVRTYASNKLNMQEALPHQKIYIQKNNQDVTINYR